METIYLRKSTEKLSVSEGQLIRSEHGIELERYPICATEQIAVYGNGQITTQALKECLKEGVRISYFTAYGKYLGRVEPDYPKNVRRRLEQYRLYWETDRRLIWTRELLKAKLGGCLVELRRLDEQGYEFPLKAMRVELKRGQRRLKEAVTVQEQLGIEGNCARQYNEIFRYVLGEEIIWKGRSSHPAKDGVNALLSLIYGWTAQEIRSELERRGLDPHCGFLHEPGYGGGGLAYDLLELFRSSWCDHHAIHQLKRDGALQQELKDLPERGGEVRLRGETCRKICAELRELSGKKRMKQKLTLKEQIGYAVEETVKCLREGCGVPDYAAVNPER